MTRTACPSKMQAVSHAGDDSDNLPTKTPQHPAPAVNALPEATVLPSAPVVVSPACVATPPVPTVASPEIVKAAQQLIEAGVDARSAQRLAQINAAYCLEQLRKFRDYPARNLPGLLVAAITSQYKHTSAPAPAVSPSRRPAPCSPPPPDPAAPSAALAMVAAARDRLRHRS